MAYARVDDIESGLGDNLLISLSAVHAGWFDEYPGVPEYKPEKFGRENSWARFWIDRFRYSGPGSPDFPVTDPFNEMPLLQYEISVRWNGHGHSKILDVTFDESTWVRISNDPGSEIQADVYGSLFSTPIRQNVSISLVPAAKRSVLNAAFDMDHGPDAAVVDIEDALRSNRRASYLAAFDIGQGSASAILDVGCKFGVRCRRQHRNGKRHPKHGLHAVDQKYRAILSCTKSSRCIPYVESSGAAPENARTRSSANQIKGLR